MDNFKKSYNTNDKASLEDQGWNAMRELLDKHMPEKKEKRRVVPLFWKCMAAAGLLILMGTYFWKWQEHSTSVKSVTKVSNRPTSPLENLSDSAPIQIHNIAKINEDADYRSKEQIITTKIEGNASLQEKKSNNVRSKIIPNRYIDQSVSTNDNNQGRQSSIAIVSIPTAARATNEVSSTLSLMQKKNALEKVETKVSVNKTLGKNLFKKVARQNDPSVMTATTIPSENVEASSVFRKNMNLALQMEASDSVFQAKLANQTKHKSDSQLIAQRQQELVHYYEDKEKKDNKKSNSKKVDLAVLFNRNLNGNTATTGNALYDLPLYPAFTASYKVSSTVGFSAGITAGAPGNIVNNSSGSASAAAAYILRSASDNKSTSNITTGNATNVNYANYADEVRQAYYWQIPVMFDYYMPMAHLKLSIGTDLSVVQQVLVVNGETSQLMTGSAYNAEGGMYQVRNFDPRVSLGAQYKYRKMLVGARFSRSVSSALDYNGLNASGGNNQVFNLFIGYTLSK